MPSWGCDLEDKFTQLCPQPSRGISHLGGRWLPPFADGSSEAHGGEKAACEPRNQGLCSATQSPVPGTPETAGAPVATSGQCWLPTGTCVDETGYSPWFFKATQQPLLGCGGGGGGTGREFTEWDAAEPLWRVTGHPTVINMPLYLL